MGRSVVCDHTGMVEQVVEEGAAFEWYPEDQEEVERTWAVRAWFEGFVDQMGEVEELPPEEQVGHHSKVRAQLIRERTA